jgi:hypothetical protein
MNVFSDQFFLYIDINFFYQLLIFEFLFSGNGIWDDNIKIEYKDLLDILFKIQD